MKSAINGGLQLSVLDGWWPEAYDDRIGWAIDGTVEADLASQDARHADRLYSLLEDHIAPLYYTRENGLPVGWLQMIRQSMVRCGPRFSAGRMLSDYLSRMYPDEATLESFENGSPPQPGIVLAERLAA